MTYILSWYIQDFLWVLGTGKILIPEIYLITLVLLSIGGRDSGEKLYWSACIGGILWDLRWLGFPGPTALVYLLTLMTVRWVWLMVPISGRTVLFFGLTLWCSFIPISVLRILLWGLRGWVAVTTYLLQQSYNLPIILFACVYYTWKLKNRDV